MTSIDFEYQGSNIVHQPPAFEVLKQIVSYLYLLFPPAIIPKMSEFLTLPQAELIEDEAERLFAMAFLMSFPDLFLNHEYTLTAKSGKKNRKTVADFRVVNQRGEELFIEVASGNKATKRKKKQHKTAALAGFGEVHLTLYGRDIEQLRDSEDSLRQVIISLLTGRYNGSLFGFD